MASKLSNRFLILCSTLAAAGGCSQILGISDYDIDPKLDTTANSSTGGDGEGGSGDSSGTAGKTSTAGKTGTGGGSGSGGRTSTGGTAHGGQPPGEAGAGGEPPVVSAGGAGGHAGSDDGGAAGAGPGEKFKGCDGTPFDGNEAILRSCILRLGCMPWLWPTDTISRCVSQNAQNVYEGTKCTLDATTCDDITACEGKHIESTFCGSGATAKEGWYCNGNEVVNCDGFVPYARDCTKEGATCKDFGPTADFDGDGQTVDCQLPLPSNTCTATTDADVCSGPDYSYQCFGTVPHGSHCTSFAASCRDVGGDIGCYYPLNSCTTEGVTCANNRATWCDGDSKVTFDCGSVGLACQTSGDYFDDSERECLAPGCSNDDVVACHESCSDTNLTLCYGGSPVTVDCKDYGFTKCVEDHYDCSSGDAVDDCLASEQLPFAYCQ